MKSKIVLKSAEIFRCICTIISPSLNTKVCYFVKRKKWPNTKNPVTFKEKLLKLKIENYNSNPLVKQCADKYAVRGYIEEKLGAESGNILNDLISVYDSPEQIEWDSLPERFAVKWNYGCGYNIIVKDKSKVDKKAVTEQFLRWGKENPYLGYAEMQYKNVPKKIIVEKFLEGRNGGLPEDYKLYCFNGKCHAILYISDRGTTGKKAGFFDADWNYLGGTGKKNYTGFEELPSKPESLDVMIETAEKLSEPFPFVRADYYDANGRAVFGELTFTPAGVSDVSEIDIYGRTMGEILKI